MMILSDDGSFQPFWRAQNWAMERLIYVHVSGDLRWAMLALVLRSLHSVWTAEGSATVCPGNRERHTLLPHQRSAHLPITDDGPQSAIMNLERLATPKRSVV